MLGRHGIYIREMNLCILFIVFKGSDLHSGTHPSYTSEARETWLKMQEQISPMWEVATNRVGYVSYATGSLCSRLAEMSVAPSITFLNRGEAVGHRAQQLNYSYHARGILGRNHDHYNRLGRELIWGMLNYASHMGLHYQGGATDLFKNFSYINSNGDEKSLDSPPFDFENPEDVNHVNLFRGYWSYYVTILSVYRIRVTKAAYKMHQKKIGCSEHQGIISAMEVSSMVTDSALLPAAEPMSLDHQVITGVLDRQWSNGQVVWTVSTIEGKDIKLSDDVVKTIPDVCTRQLFFNFMASHAPTPTLQKIMASTAPDLTHPEVSSLSNDATLSIVSSQVSSSLTSGPSNCNTQTPLLDLPIVRQSNITSTSISNRPIATARVNPTMAGSLDPDFDDDDLSSPPRSPIEPSVDSEDPPSCPTSRFDTSGAVQKPTAGKKRKPFEDDEFEVEAIQGFSIIDVSIGPPDFKVYLLTCN